MQRLERRQEAPGPAPHMQNHARPPNSPRPRAAAIEALTRREEEVLRLLVTGASNQEIAAELVISLATVKKHVSNLLNKLDVTSRTQAIARARGGSPLG